MIKCWFWNPEDYQCPEWVEEISEYFPKGPRMQIKTHSGFQKMVPGQYLIRIDSDIFIFSQRVFDALQLDELFE